MTETLGPYPATLTEGDLYVQVHTNLIRLLGGDVTSAAVLQHIAFRTRGHGAYERGGRLWWRGTYDEIAEEIGITRDQAKRSLAKLRATELLLAEEHRRDGVSDRTLSYAPHTLDRADSPAQVGTPGQRPVDRADLPAQDRADLPALPLLQEVEEHTPSALPGGVLPPGGDQGEKAREPEQHPFSEFWEAYPSTPRKREKDKCRQFWHRLPADARAKTLSALAVDSTSRDFTKDDGAYVPAPIVWLRRKRWLDDDVVEHITTRKTTLPPHLRHKPKGRWTPAEQVEIYGKTFAEMTVSEMLDKVGTIVSTYGEGT